MAVGVVVAVAVIVIVAVIVEVVVAEVAECRKWRRVFPSWRWSMMTMMMTTRQSVVGKHCC